MNRRDPMTGTLIANDGERWRIIARYADTDDDSTAFYVARTITRPVQAERDFAPGEFASACYCPPLAEHTTGCVYRRFRR